MSIRNKLIMITLFDTGIRNSELCNLLLTSIREEYNYDYGEREKERVVPVSPILNKTLINNKRVRAEYIKDKLLIKQNIYFYHKMEENLHRGS